MEWRDEVLTALDAWLELRGGPDTARRRPRRIAEASFQGEGGCYAADLRGAALGLDALEQLTLRGGDGGQAEYRVLRAYEDTGRVHVQVGRHVTAPRLYLWAARRPPGQALGAARRALAELDGVGLADRLARGAPDPPPDAGDGPPSLDPGGQRQAYAACFEPGLFLVWGPPGTGKTEVLSQALERLAGEGRRVLLVSPHGAAVDAALRRLAARGQVGPGDLLRVGPPQDSTVARDPGVCLDELARSAAGPAEARRLELETELLRITGRPGRARELEAQLASHDATAYREAYALVRRDDERTRLLVRELEVRDRLREEEAAAERRAGRPERSEGLRSRLDALEEAREEHERRWSELAQVLDGWRESIRRAGDAGGRAASSVERLEQQLEETGRLVREVSGSVDAERSRIQAELAALEAEGDPPALEAEGDPPAPSDGEAAGGTRAELERIERRLEDLTGGPRPTEAQRALVHSAEARRWPRLRVELDALREQLALDAERRPALETEHEEQVRELDGHREQTEAECLARARIVATTVDGAARDRRVAEGTYDVVLVDEAAAAPLPLLLALIARAGRTAVLFGDFRRPGGVVEDERRLAELGAVPVETWLLDDAFARCGVRTPADADRPESRIIVLDCVERLGPDVLELANASYDGRLVAAPATPAAGDDEAAVVLFDTDGLGELGTVRYQGGASGWWPAGSLLSASLARQSRLAGETVGLLTPYGPQAAATAEAVRDAELAAPSSFPLADVATVASARGRSFDTVVLDLVEGPGREGWVRQGSWSAGGRWERSGARLFTSAVACAGRRLAVIASGAVVRKAGEQSVLAPVRRLVEAGRVPVVSATSLLSRLDLPLVSVRDEMDLFEALGPHLTGAAHSIWVWAPWGGDRLAHVVPLLRGAAQRGVRVTVFAPAGEALKNELDGGVGIVRVEELRQKLLVIDDRLALLGCSSTTERGDPGDVLAVHEGSRFARHVREQEHAELLGSPPRCERCGRAVVARRSTPRDGVPWAWSCTSAGCGWTRSVASGRDGRLRSTRAMSTR